jgi:lysophospholipase L1-like esterase
LLESVIARIGDIRASARDIGSGEREATMAFRQQSPRSRLAVHLHGAAIAFFLTAASTLAAGSPPDAPGNGAYLALGDSVAFGYIANAGFAYVNATNFIGYPDYVGDDLRLDTADAACPGETTASVISAAAPDNGCHEYRAEPFPLHVSYASTQLDYATAFLAAHRQTKLVTIGLGANDVQLLQASCGGDPSCILSGLPGALATVASNLEAIIGTVRATGFRGVLVVVDYYSLDYTDPGVTAVIAALDQTLADVATAKGAALADAFGAFQAASTVTGGRPCEAGLLNADSQNQLLCDEHASQSGQRLLAATIEAAYRSAVNGSKAN